MKIQWINGSADNIFLTADHILKAVRSNGGIEAGYLFRLDCGVPDAALVAIHYQRCMSGEREKNVRMKRLIPKWEIFGAFQG